MQDDSLAKFRLQVPPVASGIGKGFESVIKPLTGKIKQNSEEMSTLVQIRDSLLPKSISGVIKL